MCFKEIVFCSDIRLIERFFLMEKLNEAFIDISKVIWSDKNTSKVHFLVSREYELYGQYSDHPVFLARISENCARFWYRQIFFDRYFGIGFFGTKRERKGY